MKATTRTALALLWLLVLIGVAYVVSQRLQMSGDLRKFMPGQDSHRRDARVRAARAARRRQATGVLMKTFGASPA